jgi:NAD+ synthase (glutamine-hydrolysing)
MTSKNQNHGFVRVATAVPKLRVGDCPYNAGEILALMAEAEREGVAVVVFPELSLTGYTCGDLFQQDALRQGALDALATVTGASGEVFSGLALVGLPLEVDCQLFNCAAVVHRGSVLGIVPKSFPPTYKEFYESRWFRPAASAHSREVAVSGQTVPFGTDLLFAESEIDDLIVGVEICEDLWVPIPPSSFQALAGATILANLSASNELIGKANYRRQLAANQSGRCMSAYLYASCGVHESTTDVVFGGHCLIAENGGLVAESQRFKRTGFLTIADIDLDRLRVDRVRTNSFGDSMLNLGIKREFRRIEFHLDRPAAPAKLAREIEAHPFVPRGTERLAERCQEIFSIQVAGLAKRLEHVEPKHVTIGISGGSDSTLALLVACKTMDTLGWSRERIHGYTMPGFGTTSRTKNNAHALMQQLGITVKGEVDIRSMCLDEMRKVGHKPFGIDLDELRNKAVARYQELVRAVEKGAAVTDLNQIEVEMFTGLLKEVPEGAQDLTFENVQARMRTLVLMNAGFTIGTGDLSELALGWCTYNADHMSGYNPNASIPKTLVKFLIRWAAANEFEGDARRTLTDIVDTPISPELLPTGKDGKIKQKTESVVGPYELHDFFMYHVLRFGASPEKILYLAQQARFDRQYTADELRQWLRVFVSRFFSQQFKRSCLPDGPKVGSISLSPRGDWRMPSDAQATLWLQWLDAKGGQGASDKLEQLNQPKDKIMTTETTKRAMRVLLRVDIQNGFMPEDPSIPGTGELPVPGAPAIVPTVNELSRSDFFDLVVDTQDFHPADHESFYTQHEGKKAGDVIDLHGLQQILWNPHCRQGTPGTEFYPTLDRSMVAFTVQKGMDRTVDSYSGFWDNGRRKSTGLADRLREEATKRGFGGVEVFCVGVTRPFCVTYTAKDAASEGFVTYVIIDACSLLELTPDARWADVVELSKAGVVFLSARDVLGAAGPERNCWDPRTWRK